MRPPPLTHIAQRGTIRAIPSARLKAPALAPLTDGDADLLADLAALEGATSGRLRAEASGLPDLHPNELVHGRPNASFINAAFIYTRPGGNRFNDARRGAWYCAFEAETALAEVAYHLTRELAAVGRFENATDYAELSADFVGPFHDIRGKPSRRRPISMPVSRSLIPRVRRWPASCAPRCRAAA